MDFLTATATAVVSNTGTDACELTAASATGPFSVEGFSATTLAPGADYSFEVVYTPTDAGPDSGTLTVATPEGDLTISLSGMGLGQPTPSADPDELTFSVMEGETGSASFTLSNTGGDGAADLEYDISVVALRPAGDGSPVTLDLSRPARPAVTSSSHLNRITEAPALRAEQRLVEVAARGGDEINVVVLTPDNQSSDPDPPTNLVNDLNAFPGINATMYADPLAAITAADLAPYDVVVLSNNQQWAAVGADVSVGDALADYVDEGGKVITFAFVNDNVGWELAGRFIDEGYSPFTMSTGDLTGSATMTIVEPDHPIAENVGPISNAGLRMNLQVRPEATLIANWTGSNPAVAHNESVVAFNVLYGALVQWTGDLDVMTYNAVVWLADQGPSMVSVAPEEGTIAPGESEEITVTFDAAEVTEGVYDFEILIATNDPATPTVTVDLRVIVGGVSSEDGSVPTAFSLAQNYPNPFASRTVIEYGLPEASHVSVSVYDAVGRLVATLVDGEQAAGYHEAEWNASGVASGVYLYRIQAGSYARTLKMVVMQ